MKLMDEVYSKVMKSGDYSIFPSGTTIKEYWCEKDGVDWKVAVEINRKGIDTLTIGNDEFFEDALDMEIRIGSYIRLVQPNQRLIIKTIE